MTRIPMRRTGLVLVSLSMLLPLSLSPLTLSAEDEKDLRGLLRDALYTEEVDGTENVMEIDLAKVIADTPAIARREPVNPSPASSH